MNWLQRTQAAFLKSHFSKFYSNSQNKNDESFYADGTVLFPLVITSLVHDLLPGIITRVKRRVPLKKQELLNPSGAPEFSPGF
jgi:hypothetical protein